MYKICVNNFDISFFYARETFLYVYQIWDYFIKNILYLNGGALSKAFGATTINSIYLIDVGEYL